MIEDCRPIVSIHAIQRFIERAMGMKAPKRVPADIQVQISEKILNLLDEHYPLHTKLSEGDFRIKALGIVVIKADNRVITVKKIVNEQSQAFRGGIMKSGSKRKKSLDKKAGKD